MTDSSEPLTETSVRERLAEFIATEWDDEINPVVGAQWPQREGDDGYRGNGGYVAIQPPDVLVRCREQSGRLLAFIDALNRRSVTSQASEGEVVAFIREADLVTLRARPTADVMVLGAPAGEFRQPLYASPSKRVERLETALKPFADGSIDVSGTAVILCHPDGSVIRDGASAAIAAARQALGDRS